jgi:proteasome lid subunit RPN8/RPN11
MSPSSSPAIDQPGEVPSMHSHRYAIEFRTADDERLSLVSIEPDFQAACEWAQFIGQRDGQLLHNVSIARAAFEPIWSEDLGAPYCDGVRVTLPAERAGTSFSTDIPISYFDDAVRNEALRLIALGELSSLESRRYAVCAYPIPVAARPREPATAIVVEALDEPTPFIESVLADFMDRADPIVETHEGDAPIFIHRSVLEATCELARQSAPLETGGVLVGLAHRDSERCKFFSEIFAQIPAQHAEATSGSFTFTHETWAAAHAGIELRGADELILGWWHSHPMFCGDCPDERRKNCHLSRPFFSEDDIHLHHSCFGQGHQLALLISDLPGTRQTPAFFGWRAGSVVSRGFHALA